MLEDKCIWYKKARISRDIEIRENIMLFGHNGYYDRGCLTGCEGYNKDCGRYMSAGSNSKANSEVEDANN